MRLSPFAWTVVAITTFVLIAVAAAGCVSMAPEVIVSDRPLHPREVRQLKTDIKAQLPLDCATYDIIVKGDQATFTYACMAH